MGKKIKLTPFPTVDYPGCVAPEDQLEVLIEKLCDLLEVIVDIDLDLEDLAPLLECLDDLKDALANLTAEFGNLIECCNAQTTLLESIATAIADLKACLEEGNATAEEIKACLDNILACLVEIKAALAEIIAELLDQGITLDAILECCNAQNATLESILSAVNELLACAEEEKVLLSEIVTQLTEINVDADNLEDILACLVDLKTALGSGDITEILSELLECCNDSEYEDAALACFEAIKELLANLLTELQDINSELDSQTELLTQLLACLVDIKTALADILAELVAQTELLDGIKSCLSDILDCLNDIKGTLQDILAELVLQTEQLVEVNSELDSQTQLLTDILACLNAQLDVEQQTWCDTVAEATETDPATIVKFTRVFVYDKVGTLTSTSDYDLEGAAYTPVGEVACCQDEGANSLLEEILACLQSQLNIEQQVWCDVVEATEDAEEITTKFMRVFAYDKVGALVSTTDYTIDGSTPYTIVGVAECCDATAEPCLTPFTPECVVKRNFCVGYENGITPGSSSNDCGARPNFIHYNNTFEVVGWNVNGADVCAGEALGPFTNWTPQLQGWSDLFNLCNPNTSANADFDFLPRPTWRYSKITDCTPTAVYGNLTIKRDDGCTFVVHPVLASQEFTYAYRYATYDCVTNTKKIVWCDASGVEIEAPEDAECYVPCGYNFGPFIAEDAVSPCTVSEIREVCDDLGTEDPDDNVTFIQIVNLCGDKLFLDNYTFESWNTAENPDDLVEYELVGLPVNCATGAPVEYPSECDSATSVVICGQTEVECGYIGVTCETEGEAAPLVNVGDPFSVFGTGAPNSEFIEAVAAGGTDLDGTPWNEPADLVTATGVPFQTFRMSTWQFIPCIPECEEVGNLEVCFEVALTNNGPANGRGVNSVVRLRNSAGAIVKTAIASDGRVLNQPAGTTQINKVCTTLTPAQAAGGIFLEIGVETRHATSKGAATPDVASPDQHSKDWTVEVIDSSFVWDMSECEVDFVAAMALAPCTTDAITTPIVDALEEICDKLDDTVTCSTDLFGPFCDFVIEDPEDGAEVAVNSSVFIVRTECTDGSNTSGFYLLDENGDPEADPYEAEGEIKNCDGSALEVAPPKCPEGAVFECVQYQKMAGILDNSNWSDSPGPHLQNGKDYVIELTLQNGQKVPVILNSTPYFPSFRGAVADAVEGCSVRSVCANHTNGTCGPSLQAPLVEYGLTPTQDELWATGWFIECGVGCGSPVVRAEIIESSDPAWVGASRDVSVYPGPISKAYVSVNCGGVFWKDCDGNDIEAPVELCCTTPCAPTASDPLGGIVPVEAPCDDADVTCEPTLSVWDSSDTNTDIVSLSPDETVAIFRPNATNLNTTANQAWEQLQAGCDAVLFFVHENDNSDFSDWIFIPANAVSFGAGREFTVDTTIALDTKGCDIAGINSALSAAAGFTAPTDLSFGAGPLVPAETNTIDFDTPSDGTANGRCLSLGVVESEATETVLVLPVSDQCALDKLCALEELLSANNSALKATGLCLCYGPDDSGSGAETSATYTNSDNETDISASNNATTLKWDITTAGSEPDAVEVTALAKSCIDNGGTATIRFTTTEGDTTVFEATSYAPNGGDGATFSGSTSDEPISGKLASADVLCTPSENNQSSESGKAVLYESCDGAREWRDLITGVALTEAQAATLKECSTSFLGESVCVLVDGVWTQAQPSTTGGWFQSTRVGLVEVTVTEVDLDGCNCPCNCEDDCFKDCESTRCGMLRVDASGDSLSQGTLDGYSLVFTAPGAESCSKTVSLATSGEIKVADVDGNLMVQNFSDIINSELGSYGFSAVLCPSYAGGTSNSDTKIAVVGPAGCGDWSLLFDSAGTGDEFELIWDDTLGEMFFNEWADGTPVTNPDDQYTTGGSYPGAWVANNCRECDPT